MFYHAFNGYMKHAFPLDELRPLSCEGEDSLGGYALTLVSQFLLFNIIHPNNKLTDLELLYWDNNEAVSFILLSQIDSLDTLALLGDREQFAASVEWIGKNLRFDIVSNVHFCGGCCLD